MKNYVNNGMIGIYRIEQKLIKNVKLAMKFSLLALILIPLPIYLVYQYDPIWFSMGSIGLLAFFICLCTTLSVFSYFSLKCKYILRNTLISFVSTCKKRRNKSRKDEIIKIFLWILLIYTPTIFSLLDISIGILECSIVGMLFCIILFYRKGENDYR